MTYKTDLTRNLAESQEKAARKNDVTDSPSVNLRSKAQTHRLASAADNASAPDGSTSPVFNAIKTLYRIYTENLPNVNYQHYIGRYFAGATILTGIGLDARTQNSAENAIIIEIVSSADDALQNVLNLAGDLRIVGRQISVLVTRQEIRTFEVAEIPLRELGSK